MHKKIEEISRDRQLITKRHRTRPEAAASSASGSSQSMSDENCSHASSNSVVTSVTTNTLHFCYENPVAVGVQTLRTQCASVHVHVRIFCFSSKAGMALTSKTKPIFQTTP